MERDKKVYFKIITFLECARCEGTGYFSDYEHETKECPDCKGNGTVEQEEDFLSLSELKEMLKK